MKLAQLLMALRCFNFKGEPHFFVLKNETIISSLI